LVLCVPAVKQALERAGWKTTDIQRILKDWPDNPFPRQRYRGNRWISANWFIKLARCRLTTKQVEAIGRVWTNC
jgi:hypothetical protein